MNSNTPCANRVSFSSVIFLVFFAGSVGLAPLAVGQPIFVKWDSGAATPDGSSWAMAYADLQSAADAAYSAGGGEVWVAQVIYTSISVPVISIIYCLYVYGCFSVR